MQLRTAIARITIGNQFVLSTGDSYLQSVSVQLSEQERASSCSISIADPDLRLLNLFLTEFIDQGGLRVPANLLEKQPDTTYTGAISIIASGSATDYLKQLESKYGASDISGLTDAGKKAYAALSVVNVRAFLDAIAVAELGDAAATNGGYGKLFGDSGIKETFDPKTLKDHPGQSRTSNGIVSTATGRYQFLNSTWAGIKYQYGLKDFKPVSQEIAAVALLINAGILDEITDGKIEQILQKASNIWASIEGNPYGQGTSTGKKTTFLANFNKFKQQYSSSSSTTTTTTTSSTTSTTNLPDTSFLDKLKDAGSDKTKEKFDVSQAVRIIVELGFNDDKPLTAYEFILTDIRGSNELPHTTKIGGKQLRAIIAKGNKTFKIHRNISLRQLATNIATKVGASVEIPDTDAVNEIKTAIAQRESDYALLLKLAQKSGLLLRGTADTLKLEELKSDDKKIAISPSVLMSGSNWGDSASADRILKGDPITVASTSPSGGAISTVSGKGVVSSSGVFTPQVCAFMNLIAWKEVPDSMSLKSYYSNNFTGYFDDADIAAGGGFPASAGTRYNVGRYQFNRGDWNEFKQNDVKGYSPADQDIICYRKMRYRNVLQPLAAGNLSQAILNAGKEWASLPGSPYGQVQAGYTLQDAIAYYNEQLKLFSGLPTTTTTQLPDTSFLDKLKDTSSSKTGGIQPLTTKADETQGIGKGFEGQLNISTIDLPTVLTAQPGTIVQLLADSGFGGAIAREYRISEVTHNYSGGAIATSVNIYLPVTIKQQSSSSSTPSATPTAVVGTAPPFTGDFGRIPKKGEKIAGYLVTSGWGPRSSPGNIGSTYHEGIDIGCPANTPYYVICKPGETVKVTCKSGGGAGIYPSFEYGGYIHEYYHCSRCVGTGTYKHGDVIAYCGTTGSSTGDHLHYSLRTPGTRKPIQPAAGWIHACLTGKIPN